MVRFNIIIRIFYNSSLLLQFMVIFVDVDDDDDKDNNNNNEQVVRRLLAQHQDSRPMPLNADVNSDDATAEDEQLLQENQGTAEQYLEMLEATTQYGDVGQV